MIKHGPIKDISNSQENIFAATMVPEDWSSKDIISRTIYTFFRQGEYDIALVDREGNQLYFGSFSLSQVDIVEVYILSVMLCSAQVFLYWVKYCKKNSKVSLVWLF